MSADRCKQCRLKAETHYESAFKAFVNLSDSSCLESLRVQLERVALCEHQLASKTFWCCCFSLQFSKYALQLFMIQPACSFSIVIVFPHFDSCSSMYAHVSQLKWCPDRADRLVQILILRVDSQPMSCWLGLRVGGHFDTEFIMWTEWWQQCKQCSRPCKCLLSLLNGKWLPIL